MHQFLEAWRAFTPTQGPFVLAEDRPLLDEPGLTCRCGSWRGYVADPDFGAARDPTLHLDLLPMPFVGNLATASVFLLMLNPGLAPSDYFGEYQVPEYRAALQANLRQERDSSFVFLEPRYSWHGGFAYWHGKLHGLIAALAQRGGVSYGAARRLLQSHLAVLQLAPYHSPSFALPDRLLGALRSVALARAFAVEELLPRARAGDCLVVVCRKAKAWGLPQMRNIVVYGSSEARAAHLGPASRGGVAILEFLQTRSSELRHPAKMSHGPQA
jgi:hypothetical protein